MLKYNAIRLSLLAALASTAVSSYATQDPTTSFDYSGSHVFTISDSVKERPFTDITFPGTHNSFNTIGVTGGCGGGGDPFFNDNNNTDTNIREQAQRAGLLFYEIDVYRQLGDWCVFHGNTATDGNTFYFRDILNDLIAAQRTTGEIVSIKIDGGSSTARDDFIEEHFRRAGLLSSIYVNRGQDETPPTYEQLEARGIRFIIVLGSQRFNFGWTNSGTDAGHTDRLEPLREIIYRRDNQDTIRWNAFALNDLRWGDKDDQRYITSRLVHRGIHKWIHAAHRISHLVTDYGDLIQQNMSPARAANILNEVPSVKGVISDDNDEPLTNISYTYFVPDINLGKNNGEWYIPSSREAQDNAYVTAASGDFDFPRPHGQSVSVRPFKNGYRFEPAAIYVPAEDIGKDVSAHFNAIALPNDDISLQSLAEAHSFIYRPGEVRLGAGVGVDSDGNAVVRDITRQEGHAIVNKGSGHCIGIVKGQTIGNGTAVHQQECDGSARQRWQYNPENGYIRSMAANGRYCLDTHGSGVQGGTAVTMYECLNNNHPNLAFEFREQDIVHAFNRAHALDSRGNEVDRPIVLWNTHQDESDNRNWYFEKHYVVSSTGHNIVVDDAEDDKEQYFMLSHRRYACLSADGSTNSSPVSASSCRVGPGNNVDNFLWREENGHLISKRNSEGACLDTQGQVYEDGEPIAYPCHFGGRQTWRFKMPQDGSWDRRSRTPENIGIVTQENNDIYLDHPRDSLIRHAHGGSQTNQSWYLVPVDRD